MPLAPPRPDRAPHPPRRMWREQLLADLKALLAAERAQEGPEEGAEGASAMRVISDGLALVGDQLVLLAREIADIPDAARWVEQEWSGQSGRSAWLEAIWRLAAVLVGGIAGFAIVRFAVRRPRRALERLEPPNRALRALALLGHNLLRLLPHLVFVGIGYGLLAIIDPSEELRLVLLALINAHLIASAVNIAGAQAFAPFTPQLRLSKMRDETAVYCTIWWRRLVDLTVYGYFFCQAALLLGLPESGYAALVRVLGIIVVALLIILILQNRAGLADWIKEVGAESDRHLYLRVFGLLSRVADFWHIPAIIYVIAGGLLSAAAGLDGFLFMVKSTAASAAIAWAAGLATGGVRRGFERGFRVSDEFATRYPGLQERVNRYIPLMRGILQGVVVFLAVILVLEAWNVDVIGWLAGDVGRAVVGTLASIIAIVVIATIVLEIFTTLVNRYLTATDGDGNKVERSQRARTLLPLARSALRVIVSVIAILMILSEIGVDIAPVLAGVGVVGLAIGFGAQTLVKDVITGLFILLEDSVSVGDVVTASGHSGVVESINIRTIRLRDLQGHVHTIPFSAVDTLTNMTKVFSYYLIEAGVAYREDYDDVVSVMRAVAEDLKSDPDFGPNILDPLEVLGLDRFDDSAVVIRARIKTIPLKQWSTGREYNRRLKAAFDAHGIEIPFPHTTIYFGEDKKGQAPAAHVLLDQGPASKESSEARSDADARPPADDDSSPSEGRGSPRTRGEEAHAARARRAAPTAMDGGDGDDGGDAI